MGDWDVKGRRFGVVMASDVQRDGIALELTDLNEPQGLGPALEVFWSDETRSFTFIAHRAISVPMQVVSRLLDEATHTLPPSGWASSS
jgi:hypothetical protein